MRGPCRVLPAVLVPVLSGLAAQVPGQAHVTGSPLFGEQKLEKFGSAVVSLGDVNGDGVPDVAVGVPDATAAALTDAGQVRVFSGADLSVRLWTLDGTVAHAHLGSALARIGDVDGDGIADLAVGAPRHDAGGSRRGRVRVVSGATGADIASFDGSEDGMKFGSSLAALGDLDLNGSEELLAGAPHASAVATEAGAALLLSIANTGITLGARFDGFQAFEHHGHAVGRIGDLDADGVADLLIASPDFDTTDLNAGRVSIRSGRLGGGHLQLDVHRGTQAFDQLGWAVTEIPDPDDGVSPRLLVAHVGRDHAGHSAAGGATILEPLTGTVVRSYHGDARNQFLGFSLATAGDHDGDGVEDFVIASPLASDPAAGFVAGAIDLVSTFGTGTPGEELTRLYRVYGTDGSRLGQTVAPLEDVDGDGRPDLVVGATEQKEPQGSLAVGAVHLLRGQRSRLQTDRDQYVDLDPAVVEIVGYAGITGLLMIGAAPSGHPDFQVSFGGPFLFLPVMTDGDGHHVLSSTIPDLQGAPTMLYLQCYLPHPGGKLLFSELAVIAIN